MLRLLEFCHKSIMFKYGVPLPLTIGLDLFLLYIIDFLSSANINNVILFDKFVDNASFTFQRETISNISRKVMHGLIW